MKNAVIKYILFACLATSTQQAHAIYGDGITSLESNYGGILICGFAISKNKQQLIDNGYDADDINNFIPATKQMLNQDWFDVLRPTKEGIALVNAEYKRATEIGRKEPVLKEGQKPNFRWFNRCFTFKNDMRKKLDILAEHVTEGNDFYVMEAQMCGNERDDKRSNANAIKTSEKEMVMYKGVNDSAYRYAYNTLIRATREQKQVNANYDSCMADAHNLFRDVKKPD